MKKIYFLAITFVIAGLVIANISNIPMTKSASETHENSHDHETTITPLNNESFFQRLKRILTGEIIDIDIADNANINPSKINGVASHQHWGELWTGIGAGLECNSTGRNERGDSVGVRGSGTYEGVSGYSRDGTGVSGESQSGNGVSGHSRDMTGVQGHSQNGWGVQGSGGTGGVFGGSNNGPGVSGFSENGDGVSGTSVNGIGVHAKSVHGTALQVDGSSVFNCNATFHCNVNILGKLTPMGGIDPPYISFTKESHESIRQYAQHVEEFEEVMQFWNGEAHRMEIYVINEDQFYTMTGELIEG